jgi:hypothetical protein
MHVLGLDGISSLNTPSQRKTLCLAKMQVLLANHVVFLGPWRSGARCFRVNSKPKQLSRRPSGSPRPLHERHPNVHQRSPQLADLLLEHLYRRLHLVAAPPRRGDDGVGAAPPPSSGHGGFDRARGGVELGHARRAVLPPPVVPLPHAPLHLLQRALPLRRGLVAAGDQRDARHGAAPTASSAVPRAPESASSSPRSARSPSLRWLEPHMASSAPQRRSTNSHSANAAAARLVATTTSPPWPSSQWSARREARRCRRRTRRRSSCQRRRRWRTTRRGASARPWRGRARVPARRRWCTG